MNLEIFVDAQAAAKAAAARIAAEARTSIAARGIFTIALSGGHTPWIMLRELAELSVPWSGLHIFQVDERVAPERHLDRNMVHIRENLLRHVPIPPDQVHAMKVTAEVEAAAVSYSAVLRKIAGSPPVLDMVHLGLGADGHTASLVPGDPVLEVKNRDVALTGMYQGRYRMTLTYTTINLARRILWVVTGSEKAEMLHRLCAEDAAIPAGRVCPERAVLIADRDAAQGMAVELSQGA